MLGLLRNKSVNISECLHNVTRAISTKDTLVPLELGNPQKLKPSSREEWQKVSKKGLEEATKLIREIEKDDRLQTDISVARRLAGSKFRSLKDSLMSKGFCRERKSYEPPNDVENSIHKLCLEIFGTNKVQSFDDPLLKFKFLTNCAKHFDYEIPNSQLYLMKTVSDVIEFYQTPVNGTMSYDYLTRSSNLPQNLYPISEPLVFNQESDDFFGGFDALPGLIIKESKLRAKKKYGNRKEKFPWPDI